MTRLKTFGIGRAIKEMRKGAKVRRSGWNGKGMWLALQVPDAHSKMGHPYVYMSDVVGERFPWNPNNLDLLARDWELVLPKSITVSPSSITITPNTEVASSIVMAPNLGAQLGLGVQGLQPGRYPTAHLAYPENATPTGRPSFWGIPPE